MKVAIVIMRINIEEVMFLGNGVIGKPALKRLNALWVKWEYVTAAAY
jgi:hypothetical protein